MLENVVISLWWMSLFLTVETLSEPLLENELMEKRLHASFIFTVLFQFFSVRISFPWKFINQSKWLQCEELNQNITVSLIFWIFFSTLVNLYFCLLLSSYKIQKLAKQEISDLPVDIKFLIILTEWIDILSNVAWFLLQVIHAHTRTNKNLHE